MPQKKPPEFALTVEVKPGKDPERSRKAAARLARLLRRIRVKRMEGPDEKAA